MADVPGAPDPKGFQFGEGGKVLLGSAIEGLGKVGGAALDSIRQYRKDKAEHNKNVSMEQWRMQAKHQMKMERNQQKHGFNLQYKVLDIAGNNLGIKTTGSETRKTATNATRNTVKLMNETGATKAVVNANKGKVKAEKAPAPTARRTAPAQKATPAATPATQKPASSKMSASSSSTKKSATSKTTPPAARQRPPQTPRIK